MTNEELRGLLLSIGTDVLLDFITSTNISLPLGATKEQIVEAIIPALEKTPNWTLFFLQLELKRAKEGLAHDSVKKEIEGIKSYVKADLDAIQKLTDERTKWVELYKWVFGGLTALLTAAGVYGFVQASNISQLKGEGERTVKSLQATHDSLRQYVIIQLLRDCDVIMERLSTTVPEQNRAEYDLKIKTNKALLDSFRKAFDPADTSAQGDIRMVYILTQVYEALDKTIDTLRNNILDRTNENKIGLNQSQTLWHEVLESAKYEEQSEALTYKTYYKRLRAYTNDAIGIILYRRYRAWPADINDLKKAQQAFDDAEDGYDTFGRAFANEAMAIFEPYRAVSAAKANDQKTEPMIQVALEKLQKAMSLTPDGPGSAIIKNNNAVIYYTNTQYHMQRKEFDAARKTIAEAIRWASKAEKTDGVPPSAFVTHAEVMCVDLELKKREDESKSWEEEEREYFKDVKDKLREAHDRSWPAPDDQDTFFEGSPSLRLIAKDEKKRAELWELV